MKYLAECYCSIYPGELYSQSNISAAVQKYSQVKVGNEVYGSQNSRSKRSSYIMAKWCGRSAAIDDSSCLRPASIAYFIKHAVQINGSMKARIFAVVHWFEYHPSRYLLGDPVELWCQLHESLGPASFLPIQRIHSKFVAAIDKFN